MQFSAMQQSLLPPDAVHLKSPPITHFHEKNADKVPTRMESPPISPPVDYVSAMGLLTENKSHDAVILNGITYRLRKHRLSVFEQTKSATAHDNTTSIVVSMAPSDE